MPLLNQLTFYNWFSFTDILNGVDPPRNNNQTSLLNMRDRLFLHLFERIAAAYAYAVPAYYRKIVEYVFLVSALVPLFILIYIHVSFIQTPVNCLSQVARYWPRDGILRIELGFKEPHMYAYGKCYRGLSSESIYETNNFRVLLKTESAKIVNKTLVRPWSAINYDAVTRQDFLKANPALIFSPYADIDYFTSAKEEIAYVEDYNELEEPQDYIIEYTLEYGFLKLSSTARQKLKVPTLVVAMDPKDANCFGNVFSQFLLKYVVGYSDVLMSSLKNLIDGDENKGFVRNVVTGEQYRFVNKSLTWTSYGIAAITMIAFTLSISMLLRYSHHQIFMFIVQLLNVLEFNLNVSFPAASLLTVVFALVGMEAIMSEFFNDSTTAFYIILIVWIADQYDSICSHNVVTKRHWLRFFFLYHFGFYAYDHRFNGQYSSLALFTSWIFIQHSMIYFFHRYELPSLPFDRPEEDFPPQNFSWTINFEPNRNFEEAGETDLVTGNLSTQPAASLPEDQANVTLEPLPVQEEHPDPCDFNLN